MQHVYWYAVIGCRADTWVGSAVLGNWRSKTSARRAAHRYLRQPGKEGWCALLVINSLRGPTRKVSTSGKGVQLQLLEWVQLGYSDHDKVVLQHNDLKLKFKGGRPA